MEEPGFGLRRPSSKAHVLTLHFLTPTERKIPEEIPSKYGCTQKLRQLYQSPLSLLSLSWLLLLRSVSLTPLHVATSCRGRHSPGCSNESSRNESHVLISESPSMAQGIQCPKKPELGHRSKLGARSGIRTPGPRDRDVGTEDICPGGGETGAAQPVPLKHYLFPMFFNGDESTTIKECSGNTLPPHATLNITTLFTLALYLQVLLSTHIHLWRQCYSPVHTEDLEGRWLAWRQCGWLLSQKI